MTNSYTSVLEKGSGATTRKGAQQRIVQHRGLAGILDCSCFAAMRTRPQANPEHRDAFVEIRRRKRLLRASFIEPCSDVSEVLITIARL